MSRIQKVVIDELAGLFPFLPKEKWNLRMKISEIPFDSLTYVKFIANLEEKLDIIFDIDVLYLDYFSTVQSVVKYIKKLEALKEN